MNSNGNGKKRKTRKTRQGCGIMVSDVEPEEVDCLWQGRIPVGKLTSLSGDPGLGKSFATLDFAGRVSTGADWPDGEPNVLGSVVLLSAEDGLADTIAPRLIAAGADTSKIRVFNGTTDGEPRADGSPEFLFSLVCDVEPLEEFIRETGRMTGVAVRLVVIDPISAYMPGVDTHKDGAVRAALAPLAAMADRLRTAVCYVMHLSKTEGKALYRQMGSIAFTAAARASLGVVQDKADKSKRLMLPLKNNLAQTPSGLSFSIADYGGGPVVAWGSEPVWVDVNEAFAHDPMPRGRRRNGAAEWLAEVLADGPVLADNLEDMADDAGHSMVTVKRAKRRAGVVSRKVGFDGGSRWEWYLPDGTGATQNTSPEVIPFAKTPRKHEGDQNAEVILFDKTREKHEGDQNDEMIPFAETAGKHEGDQFGVTCFDQGKPENGEPLEDGRPTENGQPSDSFQETNGQAICPEPSNVNTLLSEAAIQGSEEWGAL